MPIVAHAQDAGSIATYGEVHNTIVDKQITTVAEAQERAQAEILQFGHSVYTVKFYTIQPGLMIGQTINLNSSILRFTNVPLVIKRLTGQGYSPRKIRWQAECYGSNKVTFVDVMAQLLQQQLRNSLSVQ